MRALPQHSVVDDLASSLVLGAFLERVKARWGRYEVVDHWQQGEFHHDTVLRIPEAGVDLPGTILVVATNCNGGVKEVLCFSEVPERQALWHARCPDNPEFDGTLADVLSIARTSHWFDPCELLTADARSEYQAQFRERQSGGGWMLRKSTFGSAG
jgi:hypothetical protein